MEKENLEKRRTQAETEFNELDKQKSNIEARMAELRGQYQLLNEQIAALETPKEEEAAVSPTAEVLNVSKVKGA